MSAIARYWKHRKRTCALLLHVHDARRPQRTKFGYGVALYGLHLDLQRRSSKTSQRKIVHDVEVKCRITRVPRRHSHMQEKRSKVPPYVISMLCSWHHLKID
jgi:hypothetical protein